MDKMELRRLIEHDRVLVAPHRRGKARNKKGLLLNELISRLKLFSLIIVVFFCGRTASSGGQTGSRPHEAERRVARAGDRGQ